VRTQNYKNLTVKLKFQLVYIGRCIGTESRKSYEHFLIIKTWSKNAD